MKDLRWAVSEAEEDRDVAVNSVLNYATDIRHALLYRHDTTPLLRLLSGAVADYEDALNRIEVLEFGEDG